MHPIEKPNLVKGAIICLLGYFCIALMGACAKLVPTTIPVLIIVFFQNFVCLLLTLPQVMTGGIKTLKTHHPYLHLTRDIAGLLSFFALFFSIRYIPLVDGMLLQNAAPLWIPFVVWAWLKTKVPSHVWWGIIIGLIGITLIIKPGTEVLKPAIFIGLVSGMLLAVSLIAIRRLTLTEPTYRILFYYFLIASLVSFPFALINWVELTLKEFLLLLSVGIFMFLGQVLITYSFKHAKASTLSPISYSTIIFSGIFGWLLWNDIPDWISLLGMILVIFGGIMTIILERRSQKRLEKML
jgi:drug/metabolite transporter (DMT)-like permease